MGASGQSQKGFPEFLLKDKESCDGMVLIDMEGKGVCEEEKRGKAGDSCEPSN